MNKYDKFYTLFLNATGTDKQIDMCIEEMSELIKALLKERRYSQDASHKEQLRRDVIEEIADVANYIDELSMIYGRTDIDYIREQKLNRAVEKLEK